ERLDPQHLVLTRPDRSRGAERVDDGVAEMAGQSGGWVTPWQLQVLAQHCRFVLVDDQNVDLLERWAGQGQRWRKIENDLGPCSPCMRDGRRHLDSGCLHLQ